MRINVRFVFVTTGLTASLYLLYEMFMLVIRMYHLIRQMSNPYNLNFTSKIESRTNYVTSHLQGGLGNHMWIYSSLYGISKKTKRNPIACADYDITKLFTNLYIPVYSIEECKEKVGHLSTNILNLKEKMNLYYDTSMIAQLLESKDNASVGTHLQSIGYFIEYIEDLKTQFQLRKKYQAIGNTYLRTLLYNITTKWKSKENEKGDEIEVLKESSIFIAVHVRRGDFLSERSFNPADSHYFMHAMSYFRKKYGSKITFVVATTAIEWSKANIKGDNVYYTRDSGTKTREEDFSIAVACNHTIMSVGTFGYWMGFLGGGEVVYFKNWVKNRPWYQPGQYFTSKYKPMT